MKPLHLILPLLGTMPVLSLVAVGAIPGIADARRPGFETMPERLDVDPGTATLPRTGASQLLASLPSSFRDKLWVRIRSDISLEELASQLRVQDTPLAKLNDVNEDHSFSRGDWLVLPSSKASAAKQLASLDTSELRRSSPLNESTPVETTGVVRFGDNLVKLAQRYKLSIQDLLRLNPGLEAARLVEGSQIRVSKAGASRSRMVLGLKPVGSGGLSWPDLPGFNRPGEQRTDPSQLSRGWIWPARGVFSSGYGWRWGRMHKGIDIASNVGTPIVAAAAGQVSYAGWHDGGYGYLVEIQHPDGSKSLYGHNSRLLVRVGQQVSQGSQISEMGSTGRSTGPHLHFEIHPPGRGAANPLQFLPGRA
ncbi:M23 family metallopeptidase [Synechococcus sp. RedBA-s]|uniref:M23 family metallopeptidase n=1 Tax=Synechococcus sp. RedBA-s TaxID=2823741 RepID=UPI0020CD1769|nr:M23 family metallopeptidase [Synechococcus sp. RedBA-s]MCP9799538.1 M23 family metallopeptidase [Synechococcus sp. RedBA-s]